ncbi:MAG: phytoene/squalene synthase family protein [Pseudomonadota bacterium]
MLPTRPAGQRRADDAAICAAMIRGGSKSFHAASLVLPRRVRPPAYALYAFCRLADDAVDEDGQTGAAGRLLMRLRRLAADNPVDHPADRAFAEVMRRHHIPLEIPAALIEGLAWDEQGRRYETMADLEAYGARVAGTVGAMMTLIMGVRDPHALARATDLGVAMQLSNIARDVGEDAARGRLYLPRGWMRAEGLDPDAWLESPRFDARLGRVVLRLLAHAEMLYDRAAAGIGALPADCRTGIGAARALYREIGRLVAARDGNGVDSRAVVGKGRKLTLLIGAALGGRTSMADAGQAEAPALEACGFLIDAVTRADRMRPRPLHSMPDGVERALDLFVAASLHISATRGA